MKTLLVMHYTVSREISVLPPENFSFKIPQMPQLLDISESNKKVLQKPNLPWIQSLKHPKWTNSSNRNTCRQLNMLEAFLQHMHHMGLAPVDSHATISGLTIDHFLNCCWSKIVQKKRCGSSSPLCFLMDDDHDDTSSEFLLLPFPFATSLGATRENDNGRTQQTSCKPCRERVVQISSFWDGSRLQVKRNEICRHCKTLTAAALGETLAKRGDFYFTGKRERSSHSLPWRVRRSSLADCSLAKKNYHQP